MRILPDGTVEIRNKRSGETKVIKPDELPNYGISYSNYAKEAQAFASVGGKAEGIVTPLSEHDQKKADAEKVKKDIIDTAKQLQDVIAHKDQYDPKDYQNILSSMSSALLLKKKEADNLGSQLTGGEISIIAGQTPQIQQTGANLIQKALGIIPKQSTKVLDDEKTIQNKLNLLIAGLEGKPITPETLNQSREAVSSRPSVGGFVQNAGQNAKDILNGILGIPGAAIEYAKERNKTPGTVVDIAKDFAKGGGALIGGVLNEYNELLGRPLEGGDILGRAGQRAYEKPVSTALDILPVVGSLRKLGAANRTRAAAQLEKVSPEISQAVTGGVDDVAQQTAKSNIFQTQAKALAENIKGRASTSVGVVDPEDVARSEQMMGDALKITTKLTRRGMAKELGDFVPKAGKAIDEWANTQDKVIGMQPVDDISSSIRTRLESTTVGQANPDLVNLAMDKINSNLNAGELPGGIAEGQPFGTTMGKMNETRKLLNKSIPDSWFEAKPAVSKTDNLSHLNWEASKAIKDIMGEMDDSGMVKNLINKQYVALEVKPILSKLAQQGTQIPQSVWRAIGKTMGAAFEPVKVGAARALQGNAGADILNKVLSAGGEATPLVEGAVPPLSTPMVQKALPQDIIETALNVKGSPQALRLVRDLRFKQGNPVFKEQTNLLDKATRLRYK